MPTDLSPHRQHSPAARNLLRSRLPHPAVLLIVLGAAWVALSPSAFSQAQQATFANPAFQATWDRTDGPVAVGAVKRPWVWGPVPGKSLTESVVGLPGNGHLVQYFDKGRMEINNPAGNPKDPFYVTNGLLAVELISGQLQTGVAAYESRKPAGINLASDADDPSAPTYQSFNGVSNIPGAPNERRKTSQVGQIVRTAIDRQGNTQPWPQDHPDYGVRVAYFEPGTGHNVPDVFWNYLNEETDIFVNGDLARGKLFEPWFSVTGLPISEAYWSYVKVEGKYTDVLIQAFERRVLTFVPHLPSPFKVQMGNIGMHYYEWRYTSPAAVPTARGVATPTALARAKTLDVTIDTIQKRTSLIDLNSNYCIITNREQAPVRFDGWWLDSPKFGVVDRFYFPGGVSLPAGASMKVHAGAGNNSVTDVYMFRTSVMWEGMPYDYAVLYDNGGHEVSSLFPAADGNGEQPGTAPTATAEGGPPSTPSARGTATPQGTAGTRPTPTSAPPGPPPTSQASVPPAVTSSTPAGTTTATPATATVTGTRATGTATTTVTVTRTVTVTPTRTPTR